MIEGSLFIGNPVYHFEQLESTNSSAQELISKSNPSEGTAIMTSFQTHGKGQYGRVWQSSKGKNILCSIILYPDFLSLKNQFYLNIFSALAVQNLISRLVNSPVCIKWPNDIYISDKKVAGILIQNSIQNLKIKNSVVGIGININQVEFNADLPNPTSILLETTEKFDLNDLSELLFKSLQEYYLSLKTGKLEDLIDQYNSHLYLKNKETQFELRNEIKKACIREINLEGKLLLEHDNQINAYSFNEVKYL